MGSVGRIVERCLWAIGFLALAVWIAVWLSASRQQAEGNRELERRLEANGKLASPSGLAKPAPLSKPMLPRLAEGELIGRIEIPRLRVSTVVFEGTGDSVLRNGVGHLPGSPLPGEHGNTVLAAHRDTYFRALRSIRNRDTIDLVTPSGTRRYRVDSTAIVTPEHTEVLGPEGAEGQAATLTLVTCYPFEWFGHAPKRFIVRAREVEDRRVTSEAPAPIRATEAHAPIQAMPVAIHSRPKQVVATAVAEPVEEVVEEPEPEVQDELAVAVPQPNGNRMIRGLKKLNPKRLKSIF